MTPAEHQRRRELILPPPAPDPCDEIDDLVASDPILDRLPQYRATGKTDRLLRLIEKTQRGGGK